MSLAFDHLFVCTPVGAPVVDTLVAFGLTEGTPNTHPGQGTMNRRIFFHNAMLEFLWVSNEAEVRSPVIAPTQLWDRWQYHHTGYSPFGLAFRPHSDDRPPAATWPFATWAYRPPYLPPELEISMASNTTPAEPLLFVIPFGRRHDTVPPAQRQPLDHARGFRNITGVRILLPEATSPSAAVRTLHAGGTITFSHGDEHRADIEFDGGQYGHVADFRPDVPLRFRW